MVKNKTSAAIAWCEECQKLLYTDRNRARRVAREHHPHKNTYPCPVAPHMFHVGSRPDAVRQGHMTRTEYYGGAA
jgi:hypothetical protein